MNNNYMEKLYQDMGFNEEQVKVLCEQYNKKQVRQVYGSGKYAQKHKVELNNAVVANIINSGIDCLLDTNY